MTVFKTMYEVIWSIIGLMLIAWFIATLNTQCQMAAVPPRLSTPSHQKQDIEEFLNDHPDIKKRVDELNRQAEREANTTRS